MAAMMSKTTRSYAAAMVLAVTVGLSWTGITLASEPATQPAATQPAPPAASPEVVEALDRLEAKGKEIESFASNVVYRRTQGLLGDEQVRLGEATYLAGPPARFAITFNKLVSNGELRPQQREYIFDGQWLVEKHLDQKLFFKRQVVGPGETFDPLRIGQGPFPLPLGQKRDEVLAAFEVTLLPPAQDDRPNTMHLRLIPRPEAAEQNGTEDLVQVDLWYDRETLLPVKVFTLDDSENETTVTLNEPRVNELTDETTAAVFDTTIPSPGSGWRVEITPWQD